MSDERTIERVPVDDLLLDADNPRLSDEAVGKDQDDLTVHLWRTQAVDEVALSIAANGYFSEEPLLVIPARAGKWTVVEGNRRLAAVRVLRDPALQRALGATFGDLTPARLRGLDRLPVSKYDNKRQLWQFFGFRHVNGPKEWDAYAKANYVAQVHEKFNIPLERIAKSIGDRHATVKRLYRGLKILQQAEEVGFDRDDRIKKRFAFSHLYTGADYAEFQDYLGIRADALGEDPVPRPRLKQLRNLMTWLYGSKSADRQPLIRSQNPDLNTLRELLGSPRGREALEAGLDLDQAVETTLGDDRRFRESLLRSKTELERAKSTVSTGYTGDQELYATGRAVYTLARSIRDEMDLIRKDASEERSVRT